MSDVILIDLSSVLHPIWHQCTNDPNPDATSVQTIARVRSLASGQPHVAVCIDSRKSFRKDLAPTYKAQREANEPLNHQMRLTIETLRGDGFPIWGADGFEADDIIASAVATIVRANDHSFGVVVVTADKDLLQLVGEEPSVSVKSLKDGSIVDRAAVKTKTGVNPEQMHDWLCLVGDKSDNVQGCKGIGDVWAAKILNEFGTLENLWAAFDKGATPTITAGKRTDLQEFRANVWPTTRELIRLRTDVPIAFDEIFKPRVPVDDVAVFGDEAEDQNTIGFRDLIADGGLPEARMLNRPTPEQIAESREAAKSLFEPGPTQTFRVSGDGMRLTPVEARAEIDAAFPKPEAAPAVVAASGTVPMHAGPVVPGNGAPTQQTGATNAAREANAAISADERRPVERVHEVVGSASGQRADRPGANDSGRREESGLRRDGPDRSDAASRPAQDIAASGQQRAETGAEGTGRIDVGRATSVSASLTPVVVEYERALEPRDLTQAFNLAKSMFQSRLFSAYGSEHAVLSTILAGRELGMAALASLRAFHIIEGKPTLAADTIRALVLKSGAAEYFRCSDRKADHATFVTKRRGEPEMELTYTVAEARIAFKGDDTAFAKSGWGKHSADMCVARAGAKLARLVYPDVCHGIYSPEEFE